MFSRLNLKDKIFFTRNLGLMLKSGLSIIEALDILIEQMEGGSRKILKKIYSTVSSGEPFSRSLEFFPGSFDSFYVSIVKIGESSGAMEDNLIMLSEQMTKQKELKDKIKGAMVYPAIVFFLSIVLASIISFVILPKIMPLFDGLKIDLPLSTRVLMVFSKSIKAHGFLYGGGLIALFFISIFLSRLKFLKPFFHFLLLKLPIVKNITKNKNLAVFSRTLGALIGSGISIDEALTSTEETLSNLRYRQAVKNLRARINQGAPLSEAMSASERIFPKLVIGMTRVGEKSGNLSEEFFNLAGIYEMETDNTVKILSSIVEPALLIIIGLMVGGLAVAIITPIYQITGSVYK